MPTTTSRTWVARSPIARTRLSRADSWVPLMLSAASAAIRTMPPMMSPGLVRSGSQKTPR